MVPSRVERTLNGIQAGMTGGLAMSAVAVILSVFDQRGWWSYFNLLAVHFYGPRALATGPGWPTVAGLALQLTVAGLAGALFALLFSGVGSGTRLALYGVFWGVVLFFVSEWIHGQVTPLVAVHLERGPLLWAHAVYGLLLASIPRSGQQGPSEPGALPPGVREPGVESIPSEAPGVEPGPVTGNP